MCHKDYGNYQKLGVPIVDCWGKGTIQTKASWGAFYWHVRLGNPSEFPPS
jgi:hypothetical protein